MTDYKSKLNFRNSITTNKKPIFRTISFMCITLTMIFFANKNLIPQNANSAGESLNRTFFVSLEGSNTNPGTMDKPWRDINFAVNNSQVSPGDSIFVRAGVYNEDIETGISGEPGKIITIQNYENETVVIGDEGTSSNWRWTVVDQSHLLIQGFIFQDYLGGGLQIRSRFSDLSNVTIQGNIFKNQTVAPGKSAKTLHVTSFTSGLPVQNIYIFNNRFMNIDNGGDETLTVSNLANRVHISGNSIENVQNIGIDIIGRPERGQPKNIIIRNNNVSNSGQNGGTVSGIYLDGAGENILIENNIVSNNRAGITLNLEPEAASLSTRYVIVRRNILYNNSVYNLKIGVGGANQVCENVGNLHNTVAVHNTIYSSIKATSVVYFGCSNNIFFRNNIIGYTYPNSSFEYYYRLDSPKAATNTWDIRQNMFFEENGSKSFAWEGGWYHQLNDFQDQVGFESSSFLGDPKFVAVDQGDFYIQADSDVIDRAGPLTFTKGSGSGTQINVDRSWFFSDGMGLIDGDIISLGQNQIATVIKVDHQINQITIDRELSWNDNTSVNYQFFDDGPDIGAYEYLGGTGKTFLSVIYK